MFPIRIHLIEGLLRRTEKFWISNMSTDKFAFLNLLCKIKTKGGGHKNAPLGAYNLIFSYLLFSLVCYGPYCNNISPSRYTFLSNWVLAAHTDYLILYLCNLWYFKLMNYVKLKSLSLKYPTFGLKDLGIAN